eukprot:COSAG03_NODE_18190_length_360_cov_0.762452_2_plen_43_part_01
MPGGAWRTSPDKQKGRGERDTERDRNRDCETERGAARLREGNQ